MDHRPAVISPNCWIVAIVLLAIVVAVAAMLHMDRSGDRGRGLSERFDYKIEDHKRVDPELIAYEATAEIPSQMDEVLGLAAGPQDRIYVAGDRAVHVFDPDGTLRSKIDVGGKPTCLAVGGAGHAMPGRVYVGADRNVESFDPDGTPAGTWEVPGEKVHLASIALAQDDVFVADFANRIVLRYDTSGNLIGRIGQRDEERGTLGFVIPSPFFDVAVGPDGLLWVVNPGRLRLEAYTFEGHLELYWGEAATSIEGFFGCCNPAHFAILPDGRFVTAEKGLLRVKVYTAEGQFESVVAGPEHLDVPGASAARSESQFDHEYKAVDVAVDQSGRILILDLAQRKVRVYQPKKTVPEQTDVDSP